MMVLTVRGLDPDVVDKLKLRAARHGRTLEADVRALLTQTKIAEPEADFATVLPDAFDGAAVEIPDFERSGELPRWID